MLPDLDFSKGAGLVTVIAQDARTGAVLMVAHADREALERTVSTGEMHYRSRTRGLWHKGESSGNVQRVVSLTADCDGDAVLARVIPVGPACHTRSVTCFGSDDDASPTNSVLDRLDRTIASRAAALGDDGTSYTRRLLADRNLRLKKLGEECARWSPRAPMAIGRARSARAPISSITCSSRCVPLVFRSTICAWSSRVERSRSGRAGALDTQNEARRLPRPCHRSRSSRSFFWLSEREAARWHTHRNRQDSAARGLSKLERLFCLLVRHRIVVQDRPRTLLDKVWDDHVVRPETDGVPAALYVDLHLVHEVTSPQAFAELRARGLDVRRPDLTLATMDHSTPTTPRQSAGLSVVDTQAAAQLAQLARNCADFGIPLFELGSERQGIVHVIGPEQGLTQPGMTIVCGDSHTSTHGAFGALAFGIGTSEVAHVLATQSLLQSKPKSMEVRIDGRLARGVTAKDIILALIARVGIAGGTGHTFEYTGSAIRALGMEERMTICNMSIEAGARAGLIAPDETTYEYLAGRPFAPAGSAWDAAVATWRRLPTDDDAAYDRCVQLDATQLAPMITYGTNPAMAMPIDQRVPDPAETPDASRRAELEKALRYMALEPGQPLLGRPVDVVFIGSCTNSRISDLRLAADVVRGRHVAPGVRMLVVPGSQQVKRQAESEGLHRVFTEAGAEWREAGCSMCIAMNGDQLAPGQSAVSTSNRNFEGRQGKGGRTFLASPLTAAATAVTGVITDARTLA